jgi:trk system potassium uptake protein TrkH
MYIFLLGTAVFLLSMTEGALFETILFEALSAMGTVGLSMGLTGELSELGKLIIILLMFAGRVGFVTLGIAAATRDEEDGVLTDDESFLI